MADAKKHKKSQKTALIAGQMCHMQQSAEHQERVASTPRGNTRKYLSAKLETN